MTSIVWSLYCNNFPYNKGAVQYEGAELKSVKLSKREEAQKLTHTKREGEGAYKVYPYF